MKSIDPTDCTARENYKLLIGSIIPRPIAFVTSLATDGTINGAPFSFFNIVSSNPPMISIAVQRSNGLHKDTARNILGQKEFVVHIVDEENVEQINKTAASLPPDESEINLANLTLINSQSISVPGITESKIRFECILEQVVELGDEGEKSADLIIGRIVCYHIEENLYHKGRIHQPTLKAVSRLAGSDYAKIGDVFSIERPK